MSDDVPNWVVAFRFCLLFFFMSLGSFSLLFMGISLARIANALERKNNAN